MNLDNNNYMVEIKEEDAGIIREVREEFAWRRTKELVEYIYKKFPYYAINSEIAKRYFTLAELKSLLGYRSKKENQVFSIGYEGIDLDQYLNKLVENDVKVLCDVRRNAFSMKYGFSKRQLYDNLNKLGIQYVHMPKLGIESSKRKNLVSDKHYKKLFTEYRERLVTQREDLRVFDDLVRNSKRIAVMCFEHEPHKCHRTVLLDVYKTINADATPITL